MYPVAWRLAVSILLLTAAASKAWDPQSMIKALDWQGIPFALLAGTAYAIIIIEAALAGLLLTSHSRVLVGCTCALFVAFSAHLVMLLSDPRAPGCGCGVLIRGSALTPKGEAIAGLLRNMLVIATSLPLLGFKVGGLARLVGSRRPNAVSS